MRFLLTILFFNSIITFAQSGNVKHCQVQIDTLTKQSVYKVVEQMARFPGGMAALYERVAKRMTLHKDDNLDEGIKLIIAFVVQQDGKVVGQRIIRNVKGTNLAEQFLDIIDDVKWEPGLCNGKAVSTILTIPLVIDVQ